MRLTRRAFFATAGVCLAPSLAKLYGAEPPTSLPPKLEKTRETTSICCFCGVGCGLVVNARDGKVVNIEGDPDHPINEGALCSKGAALYQVAVNERRLSKVLYRAKGSSRWEEKEWDWALS
jgi:anaerobic selenocysteine-containing dehydrogenase